MVMTAEGSALVSGASAPARAAVRVRLLRAVSFGGGRIEPAGAELTVDRQMASLLVSANKAERIAAEAPPADPPPAKPAKRAPKEN